MASTLLVTAYLGSWLLPTPQHDTILPIRDMTTARLSPTATLLQGGRVLIAGGSGNGTSHVRGNSPALASAELFDPKTDKFTSTGSMGSPRSGAIASILPDGRVLVAGGTADASGSASAELYDPKTGRFSPTGSMSRARCFAISVALADGRVLVVGGSCSQDEIDASAEVYDPSTGQFTPTGHLARFWVPSSATLLRDCRVLLAGGRDDTDFERVAFAELYDPATGRFSETGSLLEARDGPAALLPDGRVLLAGGFGKGPDFADLSSAELYDPASGSFRPTGSLVTATFFGQSARLADGSVLFLGRDAEIYDPAAGTFRTTNGGADSFGASVTTLADGRVLVAGGWSEDDYEPALASAFVYTP